MEIGCGPERTFVVVILRSLQESRLAAQLRHWALKFAALHTPHDTQHKQTLIASVHRLCFLNIAGTLGHMSYDLFRDRVVHHQVVVRIRHWCRSCGPEQYCKSRISGKVELEPCCTIVFAACNMEKLFTGNGKDYSVSQYAPIPNSKTDKDAGNTIHHLSFSMIKLIEEMITGIAVCPASGVLFNCRLGGR